MTAEKESIRTGCKVNLWLRVTGRLENGYHTLDSFFLPLPEPHDTLTISPLPPGTEPGLRFTCSVPELEWEKGTVHKTHDRFAAATGFSPPVSLHLEKGIPMGAGLGGGSADAAAFLLSLNRLAKKAGHAGLSPDGLTALAAGIGADVPFFLHNTPARVGGIGEIITPAANPARGMYLLLLCPALHVPTPWAFAAFDALAAQNAQSNLTFSPGTDRKPFVHEACFQNDLEPAVFETYPELTELRTRLLAAGAVSALMSGSGSSLFGLFAEKARARTAMAAFPGIRCHLHEL